MVKTDATNEVMSRKGTAMKRSTVQGGATRAGDAKETSIELPDGMGERIAKKAHELWELRGRREGHDLQDWFDAEVVVMEAIHEARE